jgi:hypothetical protein
MMAGIGIVGALTVMSIAPAMADDAGVNQEITAGNLDLTIPANVAFTTDGASHPYSHAAYEITSDTFQIAVDDSTGSKSGWNVSMSASALTDGVDTIAASNIELASIGNTAVVAGQAATGILEPTAAGAALNTARTVMNAPANEGQGSYTLDTTIAINVPAYQPAGEYAGTVTVNLTSGPAS